MALDNAKVIRQVMADDFREQCKKIVKQGIPQLNERLFQCSLPRADGSITIRHLRAYANI